MCLLTLMPVAVLPCVFVVDINARGCVALCVWWFTLMIVAVAVLPCVCVVDINASACVALCVCC